MARSRAALAAYSKEYLRKNRDRINAQRRARHNPEKHREQKLKANFGITAEQYSEMLDKQDGVCAICHRPERAIAHATGKPKHLAVDHDHETGKVRGLLCTNCNHALGKLEDRIDYLRSAISYLEAHGKQ